MRGTTAAVSCVLIAGVVAWLLIAQRTGIEDAEQLDPREMALLGELESRLAGLRADYRRVADYRDIFDNEHQYARGLDRHDNELISSAFWPDARASYGSVVEVGEIAEWANEGHARSAAHQHFVTGLTIDVDGDTAHEEGYIYFSSDMPRAGSFDSPGTPTPGRAVAGSTTTFGTGRYVNRYERRDGEWRMIVHEYVHDISLPLDTVDLCASACLGRWDSTDISYLRPLLPLTAEERQRRAEQGRQPQARVVEAGNSDD